MFVNEPAVFYPDQELDGFDFDLTSSSPARQDGVDHRDVVTDITKKIDYPPVL